jgi:hypothetical protein
VNLDRLHGRTLLTVDTLWLTETQKGEDQQCTRQKKPLHAREKDKTIVFFNDNFFPFSFFYIYFTKRNHKRHKNAKEGGEEEERQRRGEEWKAPKGRL